MQRARSYNYKSLPTSITQVLVRNIIFDGPQPFDLCSGRRIPCIICPMSVLGRWGGGTSLTPITIDGTRPPSVVHGISLGSVPAAIEVPKQKLSHPVLGCLENSINIWINGCKIFQIDEGHRKIILTL